MQVVRRYGVMSQEIIEVQQPESSPKAGYELEGGGRLDETAGKEGKEYYRVNYNREQIIAALDGALSKEDQALEQARVEAEKIAMGDAWLGPNKNESLYLPGLGGNRHKQQKTRCNQQPGFLHLNPFGILHNKQQQPFASTDPESEYFQETISLYSTEQPNIPNITMNPPGGDRNAAKQFVEEQFSGIVSDSMQVAVGCLDAYTVGVKHFADDYILGLQQQLEDKYGRKVTISQQASLPLFFATEQKHGGPIVRLLMSTICSVKVPGLKLSEEELRLPVGIFLQEIYLGYVLYTQKDGRPMRQWIMAPEAKPLMLHSECSESKTGQFDMTRPGAIRGPLHIQCADKLSEAFFKAGRDNQPIPHEIIANINQALEVLQYYRESKSRLAESPELSQTQPPFTATHKKENEKTAEEKVPKKESSSSSTGDYGVDLLAQSLTTAINPSHSDSSTSSQENPLQPRAASPAEPSSDASIYGMNL